MESISRPALLIVEGKRDQHFFFELANWLDKQSDDTDADFLKVITIEAAGGKSKELLRDLLDTLRVTPGFKQLRTLGVVRDADDNPVGAFQSVQHSLSETKYTAPDSVLTFSEGKPRVGVFVVPSQSKNGYLEHLCLEAFAEDEVVSCVEDYLSCLAEIDQAPKDVARAKAEFQVLLAAKEPELSPEDAFSKAWFPWGSPAFDDVKLFLRMLAEATP